VKAKGFAVRLFVALLLVAWVPAAEPVDLESKTIDQIYGPARGAPSAGGQVGLLRPLGILLVLTGLAGGLYVLLRRSAAGARKPGAGRNISVIETAYISPKHSLVLVRVRNRIFLLGLGQEVRALGLFSRPEEVLSIDGGFEQELAAALSEEEAEPAEETAPYRRQIARLREAVGRWRRSLRREELQ